MKIELFNPYYNQCEFIDYFEIFLCFAINVVDNASNGDWVSAISVNRDGKVGIGDTTPSEKIYVNGNTQSKGFYSLNASVDSGIDNRLAKLVGTHFDVNYRLQRITSPQIYRDYEIGLLGDNTTSGNVFVIGGYGGGGQDPNIVFGLNQDGDGELARNITTLGKNGIGNTLY